MAIIKTKEEIIKLRKAQKLGVECFDYILSIIKPGMSEKEISKYIYDFFIKNGASGLSFDSIVGSGENSSLIHSTPSDRIIKEKDIILFDIGCILDGYCSDMSRTIFIGKPTEKEKNIYDLVEKAYRNAIEKIQPEMSGKLADEEGRKIINENGYNYNHALGHGVGKVVHESPLLSPKSEDILKEGMVFSIEPGIYIENEFGVRIEDIGALTLEGMDMFSSAPSNIIIL